MEKVTQLGEISVKKYLTLVTSIEFLMIHKKKIWLVGFLARLVVSPWLITTYDYQEFRIPIAQGLLKGGALYNDVHYNHMPIYPYLTWLMVALVGFENVFLTSFAIKLPQVIADSLIPFVIYKIGIKLNKHDIGLKASVLYTLNPIPVYEIMWATFHSIASFFMLVAFFYLLDNKPYRTGIFISLGFLTSQFPLFFFIIVGGYWFRQFHKIILSFSSFLVTTISIIAIVLIPNGTTLNQMIMDLRSHPSYQSTGQQCPRPVFILINRIIRISISSLSIISLLFFLFLILVPLYYMIRYDRKEIIIDFVVYEMIFLTIFFYCIHTKYLLWLLPFIIFWSLERVDSYIQILNLILIGYVSRRIFFYIPRDYHPNDFSFGLLGFLFAELFFGIIGFYVCKRIILDMRDSKYMLEMSYFHV